eukprot:CAMPEP_0198245174 /NCGR_PEP_ID=MMETSP1446-20131203/39578_1 /TAXON_ID=1461542 ORGANISM="Unidentified sp, Strain CCMP2111" /NCGR_SAMPLE_ID=MMETSP1446 /ASSEMBLY_ACC=CAM_ASM_001112 /LENGTH=42 /DNA_ID= /DNA_START= /DNA_END= /DNA_ORIENTATION=
MASGGLMVDNIPLNIISVATTSSQDCISQATRPLIFTSWRSS